MVNTNILVNQPCIKVFLESLVTSCLSVGINVTSVMEAMMMNKMWVNKLTLCMSFFQVESAIYS